MELKSDIEIMGQNSQIVVWIKYSSLAWPTWILMLFLSPWTIY